MYLNLASSNSVFIFHGLYLAETFNLYYLTAVNFEMTLTNLVTFFRNEYPSRLVEDAKFCCIHVVKMPPLFTSTIGASCLRFKKQITFQSIHEYFKVL